MKTNLNKTLTAFLVSTLMTAAFASCAMFPHLPPDQAVKLRVEEFMTAKVNKNWPKAYSFFEASYQKSVSEQQFTNKMEKMECKAFVIESITVDPNGERATAKVKSDISIGGFDFKGNPETQNWVKQGRKWFLYVPPKDTKESFK